VTRQRADLTFRYNIKRGRHGWIRLTPAYSIKAVSKFLIDDDGFRRVLDPFAGTGTTGLVCAEAGIDCTLVEINPFLVWLSRAKTRIYSPQELEAAAGLVRQIEGALKATTNNEEVWVPPIRSIERWWTPGRLLVLAQLFEQLQLRRKTVPEPGMDLLLAAFCRLVIEWSNAAFNHQSMSFKDSAQLSLFDLNERGEILNSFCEIASEIIKSAASEIVREPAVIEGDAREVEKLVKGSFTQVITSPPYPNRMSYMRELRPYMYWLGFLTEASQAGELDWKAIGGTWGVATSRLTTWVPAEPSVEHEGFDAIIEAIAASGHQHSGLLANYVHKYFVDMIAHLTSLRRMLAPGAQVVYIVGNSTFYGVLVPAEQIYASILIQCGFSVSQIELLRKRNSKKELYEYAVIATAR